MTNDYIRDVCFTPASPTLVRTGLLGFASFRLGDVVLDGVTVRRTRAGKFALSFPKRQDRSGRDYSFVRPTNATARERITDAVISLIPHDLPAIGDEQ